MATFFKMQLSPIDSLSPVDSLHSHSTSIDFDTDCLGQSLREDLKSLDLLEKSNGKRTIRLYQTFELYFVPTSKNKGRQFAIKEIRNDNICGIEFAKIGVEKGWVLTKIGQDEDATKLLYKVAKNRLFDLTKISKQYGYQLTFEGKELNAIDAEKESDDDKKQTIQKYDDPIINLLQSIERILIAENVNHSDGRSNAMKPKLITHTIRRYVGPFINHQN